ncbi:hypothetical protein LB531_21645 [Mesorhizobium sp. CO1-1-2]|uniref:hypothetical protein n=1 Tax=Mesorhizobium sp. CO1-1-2 TaxID=2876635 RepID=UPI001CCA15F0|nr:hypothetical protein [Mesorhizobium sp. CO1-1-2]MBZ9683265.1 hypothetical protein [Mesorhizobium sp. CO1-1-2]
MSLRSDRLRPSPRYNQQGPSIRPKLVGILDNAPGREAEGYPVIVVIGHSQPPCSGGDNDAEIVGGVRQGIRESLPFVVPSPVVREESMQDIAAELQDVVFKAAGPIKPGMGIKAQINAACDNLGYPRGHWRVREAWYGNASNWNGKAIFDLLGRYNRLCQRAGSTLEPAHDPLAYAVRARGSG